MYLVKVLLVVGQLAEVFCLQDAGWSDIVAEYEGTCHVHVCMSL